MPAKRARASSNTTVDSDEILRTFQNATACDEAYARRRLSQNAWSLAKALDAHFASTEALDARERKRGATLTSLVRPRAKEVSKQDELDAEDGMERLKRDAADAVRRAQTAFAADADGFFRSIPLNEEAEMFTSGSYEALATLVCERVGEEGFRDDAFPPAPGSVDGRGNASGNAPQCRCGLQAKVKQVHKDGVTQGRLFYGCEKRVDRCDFFAWCSKETLVHTDAAKALRWKRFAPPRFKFARRTSAADIRQGSVGDCWFLSSLAVIAEREDLLEQVVGVSRRHAGVFEKHGAWFVRLFLGGRWRAIVVDDMLPVKTPKTKKDDEYSLAFSRAANNQLWVSLTEKAYAKAHGSYSAISGGYVSEGLHDLTGSATEQIDFHANDFDSEECWARLMSFSAAGFPLGCATSFSAEGIVGHHAYSVLEVREVVGVKKGVQTKLTEVYARGKDALDVEVENLRLLKIRNPWGKREWRGEFSSNSDAWTKRLGDVLSRTRADDGEFWMSYRDFLMHFSSVDVCKSPRGWHSMNLETVLSDTRERGPTFLIRVDDDGGCWCHVLLLQHTKRGRPNGHWYTDLSVLVWSRDVGSSDWTPMGGMFGARERESCQGEIMLDAGLEYAFHILSIAGGRDVPVTLRLCSAKPVRARLGPPGIPASVARNLHLAIHGDSAITGGSKFKRSHLALCGGFATCATSKGLNFVFIQAGAARASDLAVRVAYRFDDERGAACYQHDDVVVARPGFSRLAVVASGVSTHARHKFEFDYAVAECACGNATSESIHDDDDDDCVVIGETAAKNTERARVKRPEIAPMRCEALFEQVDAAFWSPPRASTKHTARGTFSAVI
ncbi:hypothetical protein BE221DRAFT_72852 [Ostreococcus tauri]|uniref:Uncharacterized protein n=1 Tax=Ostreococcus tauri TaxID=70448 RepID=A0A1Y5IBU3_OSTTA|nr:hypothetical protein BE221DRAFT_72852 [Ostreococcus tauri]